MTSDMHLTQGSGLKGKNVPPRHSQHRWDSKQVKEKKKKINPRNILTLSKISFPH